MIKILHISDFHYLSKNDQDFVEIARNLQDAIIDEEIDLVVFSGDLVYSGESEESFINAFKILIKPILEHKGLDSNRLMLCPGNHDMIRNIEMKSITKNLSSINNAVEFIDFFKDTQEVKFSLVGFDNFNNILWETDNSNIIDISNLFIKTKIVNIKNEKIALIDINSAWRCRDSEKDRGNLLFPFEYLKQAILDAEQKGVKFILCNMHHSLSDFKEYIKDQLEEIIYEKCHFLFTGHYHKQLTSTIEASSIGLLHNRASAVYNRHDKNSQYGYCIIEFDTDELKAFIKKFILVEHKFHLISNKVCQIPLDKDKYDINEFRKKIYSLKKRCESKADDIFVSGRKTYDGKAGFKELFVDPSLKDVSLRDIIASRRRGNSINYKDIIQDRNDYIVYGGDKCGKTSLLWKILLNVLNDFFIKKSIAYYIDLTDWNSVNPKPLDNQLSDYLQLNKNKTKKIFNNYSLLLLLDNYKINDEKFKNWLENELNRIGIKDYKIIATANETILSGYDICLRQGSDKIANKLFFHEISRKQLHQLAIRWPNLTEEKRKVVETRIHQVFNQMHIPFNYWTASLFLWIFEKTDETNIHNNFELVKLYIDELLGKRNIVADRVLNLQYDDLLSYLGELAYKFLGHPDNLYTMSFAELVEFTDNYRKTHLKFTESTLNTIKKLIETGTLYERSEDRYSFRLKGVWEFFLAFRMTEDGKFLNKVLTDINYYLSFSNELELYAGFEPNNIDFVNKIFERTKFITDSIFSYKDYSDLDKKLIENIVSINTLVEDIKKISASSDIFEKDESNEEMLIFSTPIDTSEIQLKKEYKTIEPTVINIQKALFILARVYRNSRVCDAPLGDEILNFVLNGVGNLGFMVYDEFKSSIKDDKMESIVDNLGAIMPLIIQAYLYDAMVQHNLSRILEDKLNSLLERPEDNQYRIFLIGFCLLDLDINKFHRILGILKEKLKKGVLRFASKLKACFLYTNQERFNNVAQDALSSFINELEIENSDKNHAQTLLENLKKKREQKLLTFK